MSKGVSQYTMNSADVRKLARTREARQFMLRARLAKRDLDYAESGCTAPVTVEERGGRVIETRGQACLGWRSSSHVSHNS